jgi:CBS domain-containing protein
MRMRVADIMQADVEVVVEDMTVRDVIVTLADAHVHGVPVVDLNRRILGVISSSDVLQAVAETDSVDAHETLFDRTHVRDLMTTPARTTTPETEVRDAAQQMLQFDVHRLFVERDGTLAGVLSQSDIVRAVAKERL